MKKQHNKKIQNLGLSKISYFVLLLKFSLFAGIYFFNTMTYANKLDWSGGYYTLTSQTPTAKSSYDSLGSFQISNRFNLLDNLEFGFGYSLTFSKFLSGDYGYGPDIGLFYFPISSAGHTQIKQNTVLMNNYDIYRPFLCVQFHARQFQSIGASYAGFSLGGGLEYWKYYPLGLRLWGKNMQLLGPQKSKASEFSVMGGLSWEY